MFMTIVIRKFFFFSFHAISGQYAEKFRHSWCSSTKAGSTESKLNTLLNSTDQINRQQSKPQGLIELSCMISWVLALRQSSDKGLTLKTSALYLVTVANLHFQLSWYKQITLLSPPTQHHSFFRNFHPLFICILHDCQHNYDNHKVILELEIFAMVYISTLYCFFYQ